MFFSILMFSSLVNASTVLPREEKDLKYIKNQIFESGISMVSNDKFETIDLIRKQITQDNIEGDIVECGVWKGGMSIYLAFAFPQKTIWALDSYEGCEGTEAPKFVNPNILERHYSGLYAAGLDEVKDNFKNFGLTENMGINFLKGFVKETTDISTCKINKIALLRVDVDAYSATREVLENLFDKVVPGGFIIFDDSDLYESKAAIEDFDNEYKLDIVKNLYSSNGTFAGFLNNSWGQFYRKPIQESR